MKALQTHERQDPTRCMSRVFTFQLPHGDQACMELSIIPKPRGDLMPAIPHRPTNNEIIQTLNAAAQCHINTFTK